MSDDEFSAPFVPSKAKKNSSSFRTSVFSYGITDPELLARAESIYYKLGKLIRRKQKRVLLLLFCLYYAHVELDRPVNLVRLGKRVFDLTPSESRRAITLYSKGSYIPPNSRSSVESEIRDICETFKLSSEFTDECISLYLDVAARDESLLNHDYNAIAAAVVKYRLYYRGYKLVGAGLEISETALTNAYKLIAAAAH